MKKLFFAFSVIIATHALVGCSKQQPIYNVDHHLIPDAGKRLSQRDLGQAIMQAAQKRGWECRQEGSNHIVCHIQRRIHQADIAIDYTHNYFAIKNINTSNLSQDGNKIHQKYNKWIHLIENEILTEIQKKGGLNP